MQALLFRCRCGAGLKHFTAEDADWSHNGEVFCSSNCYKKARAEQCGAGRHPVYNAILDPRTGILHQVDVTPITIVHDVGPP